MLPLRRFEHARRRWLGVSVIGVLVAPGVLLGLLAAAFLWHRRATPLPARWGWASIAAGGYALFGPHAGWVWPGQVLAGAPLDRCLASTATQLLLGPLVALLVLHASSDRESNTPSAPLLVPTSRDRSAPVLLGQDVHGRPCEVDLQGEATIAVVGQPGQGKTVDLINLIAQVLRLGWSVVVLDLKSGAALYEGVTAVASGDKHLPLSVFNVDDPQTLGFNPCLGSAASIANALVSSFQFTGLADVYAQVGLVAVTTIVATLQALGKPVTIEAIVDCFDKKGHNRLQRWMREHPPTNPEDATRWLERLDTLMKSADGARVVAEGHTGMAKRLAALTQGSFGPLLRVENAIDLAANVARPSLTYVGLSALARPTDVALLGNVIIQAVKQLVAERHRQHDRVPCLLVIDETPALGAPAQLNDLLLQGREGGITVAAASQFLPEDDALRATLLGAGVVIAHRVAAPDAEALAEQFGTHETIEVSPNLDYTTGTISRASMHQGRTYNVSPDQLRNLERGQAAVRVVRKPAADRHQIVWMHKEEVTV